MEIPSVVVVVIEIVVFVVFVLVVVDVVVDELVATSPDAASFFAAQNAVRGFLLQLHAFLLQLQRKNLKNIIY